MKERLHLGWQDFEIALRVGCQAIKDDPLKIGPVTGIYGIPRGGIILAAALSHRLNVPLLLQPQAGCVVVDDVLESGKTMQAVLDGIGDWRTHGTSFWVWVSKNRLLRMYYGSFVDPDTWVVFPWEDWERAEQDEKEYHERRASLEV